MKCCSFLPQSFCRFCCYIFPQSCSTSCNTHYKIVSSQDWLSKPFLTPLAHFHSTQSHTELPAALLGQHSTGTQFLGRAKAGKIEALLVLCGCSWHCKCMSWGVPSRGEKNLLLWVGYKEATQRFSRVFLQQNKTTKEPKIKHKNKV